MVLATVLALAPTAAGGRSTEFPDPGGNESADVELSAIAPKLVGANDDFPGAVAPHQAVMAKLAKAGLNAARRTLSWSTIEPWPGASNEAEWAQARSYYDAARAAGIEPVMILGFAPYWALTETAQQACLAGRCIHPPADTSAGNSGWGDFAEEAATRFPKATFEIWNEPNTVDFWGSAPDPERWAELVRLAYVRIKTVAPQARVIACGCAGLTASLAKNGFMAAGEYLRRAFAAPESLVAHADAISLHFFPQGFTPFRPFEFGAGSHLAELLSDVRAAFQASGAAGTPIWFDEIGYWTGDKKMLRRAVTETEAASGLGRLVRRLITMPDVEAVLVHRAIDGDPGDGSNLNSVRDSTFGLLRRSASLEAKPAFCALAAMSEIWDRSDPACATYVPERRPGPGPGRPTRRCDITGTPDDDVLRGTAAAETICGMGGSDVIIAKGGNDVLRGERGNDRLRGGTGNDRILGGRGHDSLFGERGSDKLRGGLGDDQLDGGGGFDELHRGHGDVIAG